MRRPSRHLQCWELCSPALVGLPVRIRIEIPLKGFRTIHETGALTRMPCMQAT